MQKSSRLAIYALMELASNPDRQISTAEIGDKYRVSSHHLAKVFITLGRAGLVQSIRGVGGGYSFTGNAKRLTLLDIISLFEDTTNECKLNDPTKATDEEWAMFDVSKEINDMALATYGSITIATLLKQVERHRKLRAQKSEEMSV
ncbi:Rrf2 family transcriptional regulator [Sulfitobacter sp. JB4-11]|uniref:Rrf2 family transcriptional regulator n=1 Tax=Sulfitobacter rhodophyticola TaxID=3238304 RepID=UPI0035137A6F